MPRMHDGGFQVILGVMTGDLLPLPILLKSAYLATVIGAGAVALLLSVVTRGRLGYSP